MSSDAEVEVHRADEENGQVYDQALRWKVRSRSEPDDKHLVELDAYGLNGACDCTDFQTRFAPLLKRGITGRQAIEEKLVKLRTYQIEPEDALRCWHIIQGWRLFGMQCARAMSTAKRIHGHATERDGNPY